MKKSQIIFVFFLLAIQGLMAQNYAGLSIDNDLFFGKDYYYSSGIFLQYGYNKGSNTFPSEKNPKSIHWTLGQKIFNPIGRYDSVSTRMDYPFSGFLYLERNVLSQKSEQEFFSWGVQIGVSGPPSLSRPLQNSYHEWVLGLPKLSWVDQQPAAFHLGIQGAWAHTSQPEKDFHFSKRLALQLGTYQSEASLRAGIAWGPLNPLVFYGPPLPNAQRGWSAQLGIQLKYNIQDYNLSGHFINNHSPFTLPSVSFRNTLEFGLAYKLPNWQFIALAKARSKDTPNQKYERHEVLYVSIIKMW